MKIDQSNIYLKYHNRVITICLITGPTTLVMAKVQKMSIFHKIEDKTVIDLCDMF